MGKKIAFILLISIFSQNGLTNDEKFLCAISHAYEYKDIVINMPGTDKTKHCTFSCIIALECGVIESYIAGLAKELYDVFTPGTPDIKDIEANVFGIKLAHKGAAQDEKQCMQICNEHFRLTVD